MERAKAQEWLDRLRQSAAAAEGGLNVSVDLFDQIVALASESAGIPQERTVSEDDLGKYCRARRGYVG